MSLVFFGGTALLGLPELRDDAPAFSMLVIGLNFALAMVIWMRSRGHTWRPTLEMAVPTIALAVLFVVLAASDVISRQELIGLHLGLCGPACLSMLVVMLFRFDLYAGHHHAGHRTVANQ